MYTQIFKIRHVFELFKQNPKLLFIFPLCILCDSQNFYNSECVTWPYIYHSFIHPSVHLYIYFKREGGRHTQNVEKDTKMFFTFQTIICCIDFWERLLIIEVFYHSKVNTRFWRPGFYQCGTILLNVALSLKILIIAIIIFSESQKDTKLYMDVLTACVPRIVHCSIIIFESGNREVTRLKLVSNLWGIYPTWFQVLQTF